MDELRLDFGSDPAPDAPEGDDATGGQRPDAEHHDPPRPGRVVRVLPDVAGVSKEFDYLVPDDLDVPAVGAMVRIELGPRRLAGWVVDHPAADSTAASTGGGARPLKAITKVSGLGPPAEVIDLCRWAAQRWIGPVSGFMGTASPPTMVASLPSPPRWVPPPVTPGTGMVETLALEALAEWRPGDAPVVLRVPPAADTFGVVLAAARRGPALVVCPSHDAARHMVARLGRAHVNVATAPDQWASCAAGARVVVGARSAAFAPIPDAVTMVVIDEHDEAHQSERSPTWHARDVVVERARRQAIPAVLVSPVPSAVAVATSTVAALARGDERRGWAPLEVVDLRQEDPASGLLTAPLLEALRRREGRCLCVLNRTGRSRLVACHRCRELATCHVCSACVVADGAADADAMLECRRCGERRPVICTHCGATRMRHLRPGVSRVADDLAAAVGEEVDEVTASGAGDAGTARVVVGTEALLHRIATADLVAFLDLDQELTAPRTRAAEEALVLLARAARVVRGRQGRVLVQTRLVDHDVVVAARRGDPTVVVSAELERRALLGLPPAKAVAHVDGAAADVWAQRLEAAGVVVERAGDGSFVVRADDHRDLSDALRRAERPSGRLRVAVDPLRW